MADEAIVLTNFPAKKKLGGPRIPRSGFYKRSGCYVPQKKLPPVIEAEPEEKPVYVAAPITLAAVSTHTITDLMVGLEDNPQAQEAAETYIKQTIAWNRKQAERTTK